MHEMFMGRMLCFRFLHTSVAAKYVWLAPMTIRLSISDATSVECVLDTFQALIDGGLERKKSYLTFSALVEAVNHKETASANIRLDMSMKGMALLTSVGIRAGEVDEKCDGLWKTFLHKDQLRLVLVAGMKPTKRNLTTLLSGEGVDHFIRRSLRSMMIVWPEVKDAIGEKLKKCVLKEKKMMKERKKIEIVRKRWNHALWSYCWERVVDIAMVFVALPDLIIVEICLLDRNCLRTMDENLIWNVARKIKRKVINEK